MDKKNLVLVGIILILLSLFILISDIALADFQPYGNIVMNDQNLTGANKINATIYYGDGSQLEGVETNSSEYWDDLNTFNSTQMEDSSGTLNILVSWLESLFISDTDEGNLNVNRSDYWDGLNSPMDIPHATPSNGDITHFSLADEIYDWVMSSGYATLSHLQTNYYNNTEVYNKTETYTQAEILALNSSWNYTTDTDTTYSHLTNFTDNLGDRGYTHLSNFTDNIGVSSDWDEIGDVPTATPGNGDTTHLSTADQIYDFVISLNYKTLTEIVSNIGNWSADKSSYYTSTIIDTLGNWSQDKGNYYNSTEVLALNSSWDYTTDTNTNANTICSGGTTYLDGEGNCDDLSNVYINKAGDSTGALTSDLNIDANTLVVDYDTNEVGIGIADPLARLHVNYPTSGDIIFQAGTGDGASDMDLKYGYNGYGWYNTYLGSGSGDGNEWQLWSEGAGTTDMQVYGIMQSGNIQFMKMVSLNAGTSVNDIDITVANDDNALITSGGVYDGLAGQDACSEITGCVENAITDGNTNWDNSYGFYNNIANFTGTLTNSKWCLWDGSEIDCNVEPVSDTNTQLSDSDILTLGYNHTSDIQTWVNANDDAGLTDLTDFDQTAWRLFYSNNLGDVIELSLGTDGQYLQSQGGTSSLTWSVPINTDTQDLSYNTATDVISLTDGGSIDITEVDTNTNCSADQSCANILYTTDSYLGGLSCADTQIAKYNSTSGNWECEGDETGAGGTITGSGTAGKITKWTSGSAVGDSIISESGSDITVAGKIKATDWTNVSITESQVSDADWYDSVSDIPTATPSDGDTTHLSTADHIFDYIASLAYATTSYVDTIVASVGNWSEDKSSYWNTSTDLDTVIATDEITELKIDFNTACAAGNHLYINGNNLACEADDDTTYTAGGGLTLTGTQFNHTDTSSQSSSDNSARTYIQDIILDTYGHITSIVTATETVTNTDTQDLSYDTATDVISLVDGGSIDITEVDTDTHLTEDQVEAYIFDSDNTANLDLNNYNITGINSLVGETDPTNMRITQNASCWTIHAGDTTFSVCE